MPSAAERRAPFLGVAAALLAVDLASKALVESLVPHGAVRPVAGDWMQLRLVYNPGAAFGLDVGPYSRWIFLVIALLAVALVSRLAWRTSPADRWRLVAYGLVAGGAAGNGLDRLRSARGVVDFLDLGVNAARWPTFNVADIGVTCGALALAISFWLEDARQARIEAAPPAR